MVEVARLDEQELEEFVERLDVSLQARGVPPLTPMWEAEIEQRVRAYDAGEEEAVDWEEGLRLMRQARV